MRPLVFQPASACIDCHPPSLSPTDIHVWGVRMEMDEAAAATFSSFLSTDEQQRAARLISASRRLEFIAARGALRLILAAYTKESPADLEFPLNESGKPFLTAAGRDNLRFNVSHSCGRAVIAVGSGRDVGVDLESARPQLNALQLAERFLSQEELSCLRSVEETHQPALFRRLWVVREAVAKAYGTGLHFPLNQDYVQLSADATEGHVMRAGKPGRVWARFIPMDGEWVGAVAAGGSDWRVVLCPT